MRENTSPQESITPVELQQEDEQQYFVYSDPRPDLGGMVGTGPQSANSLIESIIVRWARQADARSKN